MLQEESQQGQSQPQQTTPDTVPAQTPPAAQPTQPTAACKCPAINSAEWDKQRKTLNKTFYKAFSPRLFYIPFSFAIDLDRARKAATKKGYQVVDGGMVMDNGGMFWGSVLVEVTGANTDANASDKSVVSLAGKELYSKVFKGAWKELKSSINELTAELGAAPAELYIWYTSCPKCAANKEVKAVLLAVPAATQPAAAPAAPADSAPQQPSTETPAPTPPQPPAPPAAQ